MDSNYKIRWSDPFRLSGLEPGERRSDGSHSLLHREHIFLLVSKIRQKRGQEERNFIGGRCRWRIRRFRRADWRSFIQLRGGNIFPEET